MSRPPWCIPVETTRATETPVVTHGHKGGAAAAARRGVGGARGAVGGNGRGIGGGSGRMDGFIPFLGFIIEIKK